MMVFGVGHSVPAFVGRMKRLWRSLVTQGHSEINPCWRDAQFQRLLSGNPPPQGPDAAPASIFEGITASKGFAGYWNRVAPVGSPGTANANRTLFHILSGD